MYIYLALLGLVSVFLSYSLISSNVLQKLKKNPVPLFYSPAGSIRYNSSDL